MTNKRFFFFSYSYSSPRTSGNGNTSLICNNGFPSQNDVKKAIKESLKDTFFEPEYKFSVVVLSWIELNEDDYSKWIA